MTTYIDHPVYDRLYFAEKRLNDLRLLNGGDIAGAQDRDRQPLIEEFFFHLGSTVDFLLQQINETCKLGVLAVDVNTKKINARLKRDPKYKSLVSIIEVLHPDTRNDPMPGPDPYTPEASLYRVVLFRNFVTHVHHNLFLFSVRESGKRSTHLRIEPSKEVGKPIGPDFIPENSSKLEASDEMDKFLKLATEKCTAALKEIGVV